MAYTIKGLAKANECETFDANGLASLWNYWLVCNSNDRQSVEDFKRLRKKDRTYMLGYVCYFFPELHQHILKVIQTDQNKGGKIYIEPLPF